MTIIDLHTPHTGKYDQPTALFINNEWVEGKKKQTIEVVNPTDESVCATYPQALLRLKIP